MSGRLAIGGLPVDAVSMPAAVDIIEELVAAGRGGAVFTPNVDHVVLAQRDDGLRRAYARADLCLADGRFIVWAARLLGWRLPGKVSGSDVVWPLMRRARDRGWRVYLLGGAGGVAERAAEALVRIFPGLRVVGVRSPRVDMGAPPSERAAVFDDIRSSGADVVMVALGAPKQELFIHEARATPGAAVFLGVGATLDFVAGTIPRCPRWMSSAGLEWFYRLAREPRRLWRRYLVRDPEFFLILLRQLAEARLPVGGAPRQ